MFEQDLLQLCEMPARKEAGNYRVIAWGAHTDNFALLWKSVRLTNWVCYLSYLDYIQLTNVRWITVKVKCWAE